MTRPVTRQEVLAAALDAVNGDKDELVRRMGLNPVNGIRQYYLWRRGQGMNFDTTVKLLQIAGVDVRELLQRPKP